LKIFHICTKIEKTQVKIKEISYLPPRMLSCKFPKKAQTKIDKFPNMTEKKIFINIS